MGRLSASDRDPREGGAISLARRSSMVLMMGVLVLALALRLWGLDAKGVWQDEIFTAAIASPENSLAEVASIPLYNTDLPAPPLYFLLTHLLLRLGDNDFLLRFPALVFGILGVAVTYPLGVRLLGRMEGLVGAFLLAMAPFHVRYSQDARFYTLLVFLSLLSVYALYRAVLHRERDWFLVFMVGTVANLYNHLFAFLVLGAEIVFVLGLWLAGLAEAAISARGSGEGSVSASLQVTRSTLIAFAASLVGIALAYAPMFSHLWRGLSGSKGLGGGGAGLALDATPLLQAVDSWGLGSGWRILILLAPFVLGALASARTERPALWLLGCWVLVPFALLMVLPAGHNFRPRYVLFMLPIYLLFVARGSTAAVDLALRTLRQRRRGLKLGTVAGLSVLIAVISVPALHAYYEEDRVDWRGVSSLVASQIAEGEIIVSPGGFPQVVMPRYERALREVTFVIGGSEKFLDRADGNGTGVWFVGPAREKMQAMDSELTQSGALFFKVVFQVDGESTARGRALKIAPVMYDDLWVLFVRQGLGPGDVEARYRRASEAAPHRVAASIHITLGDLLRSEGELEQAIAEYQRASALDPHSPAPHYGLALTYKTQGLQELYETEWRIYQELSGR